MCHIPEQGFTNNEMATAVGLEGRTGRRNSPTLYNVAYAERLFHDGREDTLEQQVWGPLLARNEMGNPSPGVVLRKLKALPDYQGLFEQAFDQQVSMETIGMALASYQRTLISANSPFDQWFYGKDEGAISATAKRGYQLFIQSGCVSCHRINSEFALFTDHDMHNTGHGFHASMKKRSESKQLQVVPGQTIEIKSDLFDSVSEKKPNDVGLYEITENPADRWKYKTPTLRNISLTAPYMHDGAIKSLGEVIDFYNNGGVENDDLDPLIKPLGLTQKEADDLLTFLNTLTGSNVDTLISDAFAAPVGDSQ